MIINPHDPTGYNEWWWKWAAMQGHNPLWWSYLEDPYLAGRFWSSDDQYDMDDIPVWWVFRDHVVPIEEAINMCFRCQDYHQSWGSRLEPPDAWCAGVGECRMRQHAVHVLRMLCLDPTLYPSEEW